MFNLTDHEKEYSEIWISLLFLLFASVGFAWLMVPHWMILILIFGVAIVKSALVAKYFMHLTKEASIIIGVVITPFILLAILIGLLWPDFGIRATDVANIPGYHAPAAHPSEHGHPE